MCVDVDGWTWKMFSCLKKRLHNLYSTSTFEQAACCTLSAQIPRILHILLSNLFTHPNNSLYTPQHSVRNLTSAIDFWGWNFMPPTRNMPPAHFPHKFQSHHLSLHYFPHIGPVQQPRLKWHDWGLEILTSFLNWMCYSVQTNSKQPMHCSCRNWKHAKSRCISAEIQSCFLFAICFTAARNMQGRDLS